MTENIPQKFSCDYKEFLNMSVYKVNMFIVSYLIENKKI